MDDPEYKTYQPKWEEKKKESDHRHHHHHHEYKYTDHSGRYTNSMGGWLKMRDRQAYYGLILIIVAVLGFGVYSLVKMFVNELKEIPKGDPSQELKVDELGIRKVDEADALYLGDSLARELNVDTLVRFVKAEEHNVYRPPRKRDNELIDQREWKAIFKNLRRWFRANGGDPKFIIGMVLFGLFILSLVGYGIYKHNHKHRH